jgi:hypothetical protein
MRTFTPGRRLGGPPSGTVSPRLIGPGDLRSGTALTVVAPKVEIKLALDQLGRQGIKQRYITFFDFE